MLTPLTHAIAAVEGVVDRTKHRLKSRFDLWENVHAQPYGAWGTEREVRFMGRVLDDKRTEREDELTRWGSVLVTARRFRSDEILGARVRVTLGETTVETTTDGDGYYDVTARLAAPPADGPWHSASVQVLSPVEAPPDEQRVLIPPASAAFGVISDMDDTVIRTGATNKLRFARVVLLNNATTREVFPGVGAFYQALQGGPDGEGFNPFFYVSSSPWNLYRQFMGVLQYRGVPMGPLFLKDFGIDPGKFVKSGHGSHKLEWIGTVLGAYPHLRFVLIGDSGQEDPEIYQQAVARHPGRIRAVFIRDVTDERRDREIHAIARDVEARGVPMRLVTSTEDAAEAAADLGLVAPDAVGRVREASQAEAA